MAAERGETLAVVASAENSPHRGGENTGYVRMVPGGNRIMDDDTDRERIKGRRVRCFRDGRTGGMTERSHTPKSKTKAV